jgi:hypothetical protein
VLGKSCPLLPHLVISGNEIADVDCQTIADSHLPLETIDFTDCHSLTYDSILPLLLIPSVNRMRVDGLALSRDLVAYHCCVLPSAPVTRHSCMWKLLFPALRALWPMSYASLSSPTNERLLDTVNIKFVWSAEAEYKERTTPPVHYLQTCSMFAPSGCVIPVLASSKLQHLFHLQGRISKAMIVHCLETFFKAIREFKSKIKEESKLQQERQQQQQQLQQQRQLLEQQLQQQELQRQRQLQQQQQQQQLQEHLRLQRRQLLQQRQEQKQFQQQSLHSVPPIIKATLVEDNTKPKEQAHTGNKDDNNNNNNNKDLI